MFQRDLEGAGSCSKVGMNEGGCNFTVTEHGHGVEASIRSLSTGQSSLHGGLGKTKCMHIGGRLLSEHRLGFMT